MAEEYGGMFGCTIIKYGMGSKTSPSGCVLNLQWALNQAMKAGLVEDGIFGSNTLAAVRAYQQAKGLVVDGIAGDNTQTALYADLAAGTIVTPKITSPITMKPPVIGAPVSTASTGLSIPGLGTINWTTVGIIAAIALAAYFIFGSGGFSFAEEPASRKRRR